MDLMFISRQLEHLTSEVVTLRDEVAVLTAITVRLDGSQLALLNHLRVKTSRRTS